MRELQQLKATKISRNMRKINILYILRNTLFTSKYYINLNILIYYVPERWQFKISRCQRNNSIPSRVNADENDAKKSHHRNERSE